jgi:DNA-binding transcriptional LysR family regulator
MNRQTWADLSTFAAIADAGSFTGAAKSLGISPSALSHAMRAMETRLGVRLLNRSTRSVAPTEAGERLLARLRPALDELDATVRRLEEDRDKPAGRIRISAHKTASALAIEPKLPAFASAYPDVQVELAIEDGLVDIVKAGFDAGVRHQHVLENDMISVRDEGVLRRSAGILGATQAAKASQGTARSSLPCIPADVVGRNNALAFRATWSDSYVCSYGSLNQ